MDTGILSIKKIFGQERRHLVPLFQRPYVWTREEQWEPLWEDITGVADRLVRKEDVRPHFLGAVVLDPLRKPTGHLETRLLIDGQQRFTTIQIVLEAFCDFCDSAGSEKHHRALLKLTRNDDPMSEDPDEQFKVWPTNVDQEHFRRVMLARSPEEVRKAYNAKSGASEIGHAIADAYLFFHDAIAKWLAPEKDGFGERLESLYTGVREYVRMVVIDLDKGDDAQLIFETLNARGTPLLPSDLIKNFLFHRAQAEGENLPALYTQFWKPFDDETNYWRKELGRGHARRARIDTFLQYYLTLLKTDDVEVGHLYATFRDFFSGPTPEASRTVLQSIRTYAQVFQSFEPGIPDDRVALFFERLAMMDITTAYPFLMGLFARFGSNRAEILAILGDLESFLVRRLVCQLNTRGYNRLFIDLLKVLAITNGTPSARVREFLLSSTADTNRWPKDDEFGRAWMSSPLFKKLFRQRVRMLLEALERELHTGMTEKIQFGEKLTIEHLLPQGWRKHWPPPALLDGYENLKPEDLREELLHSMGNLTLVTKKLNPSISNGPWDKKLPAILKHSSLSLNRELQHFQEWGDGAIVQRGLNLFELAKKIWPVPDSSAPDGEAKP